MPNRCVDGGCSNVPDPSQNIGLHKFPEDNDLEKKRQRLWVAFVRTKCAKWSPTANFRLCSQHFQTEDFQSPFVTIPGTDFVSRSVLQKGAVSSIHKTPEPSNYDKHGQSQDGVDPTHPSSTKKHHRIGFPAESTCKRTTNTFCFNCLFFIKFDEKTDQQLKKVNLEVFYFNRVGADVNKERLSKDKNLAKHLMDFYDIINQACCNFKTLCNEIVSLGICKGTLFSLKSSKSVKTQLVPLLPNDSSPQYRTVEYCRALSCRVLVSSILSDSKQLQCESCSQESNSNVGNFNVVSVKCKTPLSCLSKEQLIATVKDTRVNLKEAKLKCAQLERRVQRMENEIKHHGIRIETGLEKELTSIITNTSLEATPHMKLVWEQQKKALNQQSNFELRDSGTMQLPSSRTLRSYRNNFKPGAGYLPENIKSLISRAKGFLDKDRWIVVMFDEMKIKCNLVFDKHSGHLIGFVDLGDPDINYSTFDKIEPATHVLAFYVRGITTKLQFMLGYFFT
ncbi:Transposable element P transposase [Paramuricea clavata]|uniref:Transposable element P transposase n=1 Tax=Paramuricea clavata TaxID=317549 RepID=A0A7D9DBF9_PARCT|nr:Transposable element P transposase [Paramuricea clavata]